jgi:hypothetical protein
MTTRAAIHAHPRFLVATDFAALVLVELLLLGASRVRFLVSPLAFVLLAVGVLAGFAADILFWFWKGIRSVAVEGEVLTVFSGRALSPRAFPRRGLRVKISRMPGSRGVRLKIPGRPRVKISEAAFPREEFTRFLLFLETWAAAENR